MKNVFDAAELIKEHVREMMNNTTTVHSVMYFAVSDGRILRFNDPGLAVQSDGHAFKVKWNHGNIDVEVI